MKGKGFPGITPFTHASLRRVSSLSFTGIAMIVMLASTTQKAYAHFPNLIATASCSGGAAVINYTVGSWNPGGVGGSNPDIRVFFNGAVAADGALDPNTTPPDQFSGTLTAPQGTNTVDVVATAESAWDDGFAAGDSSSVVTVTIPTNCAPGTGRFTGGGKTSHSRRYRSDQGFKSTAICTAFQQPRDQLGRQPLPHDSIPVCRVYFCQKAESAHNARQHDCRYRKWPIQQLGMVTRLNSRSLTTVSQAQVMRYPSRSMKQPTRPMWCWTPVG